MGKKEEKAYMFRSVLVISLLILLASILAIGCAIWEDYRDKIISNQKEQLLLASKILAENMELSVSEYQSSLSFLCSMAKEENAGERYETYLKIKDHFENNLFMESGEGEQSMLVRQIMLDNPRLITQTGKDESIWMYDDQQGEKHLVFKKRLTSGDFLCLSVNEEEYYRRLLSMIQIGTNGYIVVKNSEGIILMHPEKEQWGIHVIDGRKKMYPDMDYSSLEKMVEEQGEGKEGISEYYSYWWMDSSPEKVKKISAYAPVEIGNGFWTISAVVDYDDFYEPVETGFRRVAALFMGALIAFALLTAAVGRLLLERKRTMEEIGSLRELNERLEKIHQGEEMIAHQQRLQVMGTMTGGIAHEFNNFLTPIMGHSELLMLELPEGSDEYESAKEIYDASEKAKDVIRQLSALSRRNVETVYKRISAAKLLNRAVKMIESICPANVCLEKAIEIGDEYILGNATQINQVLLNICVNGIHAIGRKEGTLKVESRCVAREMLEKRLQARSETISGDWNRYIEICVRDNGCGMDADTLRQIFTPFFTTKKSGEGTGLGLALAEQFVTSHKGYLYVESQIDKGSVFYIYFPVMEAGEMQEVTAGDGNEGMLVLIADDNVKVLKLLEKNFSRLGLKVMTCRTKKEVYGILEQTQVDVLLLDESMTDGSGIDLCMAIQGKYPEMIKIIMADYFTKDIVEAEQKKVIDGYLAKPVSETAVLEAVRNCRK